MRKYKSPALSIIVLVFCVSVGWTATQAQTHDPQPTKPTQTNPPSQPTTQPTTSKKDTLEVVFGEFRQYVHPSGWFSMSVPSNWKVTDKSLENELIVSMADPTENAVLVVRVWKRQTQMTQEEKTTLLKSFLADRMSGFQNFTMGEPKPQKDGSIGIYFKYDSVVENDSYPMFGDSFIEQKGILVGLMGLIIPQEQYDKKKDSAYKFVNSFSLNSSARQ